MIFAGADLGADRQLGGTGGNADSFGAGLIGPVTIKGNVIASVLAAGLDPLDGVLHNGDAILAGAASRIARLVVNGTASADSYFAGKFPSRVSIGGQLVTTASDPRFFTG